jgi:membrane-associated protease RseP (regulator of RpoE activity)
VLLRKHLKLDNAGLVVQSVSEKSPAAAAGIEADDVLISLNDIQLQTRDQLVQAVAELENQTVRLQLIRNGERREVSVTPRKMRVPEGSTAAAVSVAGMPSFPNGPIPGLDGEFGQVFPGVIIDEQFPADPEAIKRLLKRFGSEVRGEARRAEATRAAAGRTAVAAGRAACGEKRFR